MIKTKTHSGSDTSDNDEDKHSSNTVTLNLPHKRKDSGNSSDNDGPPTSGGGGGNQNSVSLSCAHNSGSSRTDTSSNNNSNSPCAKKKYGGSSRSYSADCAPEGSINTANRMSASSTHATDKGNSNGNNKDCDSNSLRVLANKFVDSSLARLSNFSLASQTSSISSRSSNKYSTNTTPRSSQRRSKEATKFSKAKLMQHLKMDLSELSDRELTDSDCGSLQNSLKIKISTATGGSVKEYSVIAEEQSQHVHTSKKTTDCCSVM